MGKKSPCGCPKVKTNSVIEAQCRVPLKGDWIKIFTPIIFHEDALLIDDLSHKIPVKSIEVSGCNIKKYGKSPRLINTSARQYVICMQNMMYVFKDIIVY